MAQSSMFSTSSTYTKYRIVVTEISTNASNNTSIVRVEVRAWNNKSTTLDYDGDCKIKIDGVEYPASSWSQTQKSIGYSSDYGETGYTTIYGATHTIYHNYDGTKKIRVSAGFELYETGTLIVGSNFNNSYEFTLTDLNRLASVINAVGNCQITSFENILKMYVKVYNTENTHTITLKDGSNTVCSFSGISLVDGYNEINITSQVSLSIHSYMSVNNLTSFVGTWVLSTQSGQSSIGSSSSATSLIYEITYGQAVVSLRTGKVGIKNTNPQYELDVNGTVNCTTLQQSTPTMEIQDGHIIKILRW